MLRQFHESLLQDVSGVRAVACYVAKFYHLTQVRNTLPWSRRNSHLRANGYEESLAVAKEAAEQARLPGSESWIREVPAIVVRGDTHCLVVATKSSLKPFEEFSDCDFRTPLIGAIARTAAEVGYVFVCDHYPEPAEHTFRSFVSKAGDAKRPLAWSGKSEVRDLNDLQELLSKLKDAIAVEKWMTASGS